ncbi:hypothetical protein FGSG_05464 [Fusarium graminearum PH-1]|uniref:hypothetical protein n=1 Tax=Gibberella zeae (strain ATCC MYA-4620 / CBS 123657 / FGSC 9075 / NRRL 31084 / PH-1) TaxID=229533 RepID=UPI00021F15F3|nr:hypothetical protein FGSG_05464 [Fusarium graminearum PH-1]ESU11427.1 hypothetical protein FGSG_05464 [Fusarium graminearum PH-1]|eukprot:XP_011324003.1 hypothetical protein FGSG_05464 [Fusarium graminearum PH-1]
MAGSNYANTGSLNDARELQKMFKGQSSDSSSGKNRGRSKGGNSLPMKRQETFSHSRRGPPPTSSQTNVPPPSARYYTATLLSDPLKRAPGPILGSSTLAFLSRQDPAPQAPAALAQTAEVSTTTTVETKVLNKEEETKKSIAGTFFSLMSGDSDEHSDEESPTSKVQDETVNKSSAAIVSKYSSDEILKLRANAEKVMVPSNVIVRRTGNERKAPLAVALSQAAVHLARMKKDLEGNASSFGTGLQITKNTAPSDFQAVRPQATVTQPSINTVETSDVSPERNLRPVVKLPQIAGVQQQHQVKTELSSENTNNMRLRPDAPGFVPKTTLKSVDPSKTRKPTKGLGSSMWAK